MTSENANACAAELFDLFPSLNPAQVREWADEFERYERPDVIPCLSEHYRETPDGFVKPARLRDLIRTRYRKRLDGERWARGPQGDDVADEWKLIDATVNALPPAERDRLTAEVLADGFSPEARALLEARGVTASKTLRGLVFERWKRQRPEAAA